MSNHVPVPGPATPAPVAPFIQRPDAMSIEAITRELVELGERFEADDLATLPLTQVWNTEHGRVTMTYHNRKALERELAHRRALVKGIVNLKTLQDDMREVGLAFGADPRGGAPFVLVRRPIAGIPTDTIPPFETMGALYKFVWDALVARDQMIDGMIDEAAMGDAFVPWL